MASSNSLLPRSANTSVVHGGGATVVTYHKTPVVSFNSGAVLLDTGGYQTPTTKTRMNQAAYEFGLNYQVFQKKGLWFANTIYGDFPFRHRRLALPHAGAKDQDCLMSWDDHDTLDVLLAAYRDEPTVEAAMILADRLTELDQDISASAWRAFARDAQALYAFHGNGH